MIKFLTVAGRAVFKVLGFLLSAVFSLIGGLLKAFFSVLPALFAAHAENERKAKAASSFDMGHYYLDHNYLGHNYLDNNFLGNSFIYSNSSAARAYRENMGSPMGDHF